MKRRLWIFCITVLFLFFTFPAPSVVEALPYSSAPAEQVTTADAGEENHHDGGNERAHKAHGEHDHGSESAETHHEEGQSLFEMLLPGLAGAPNIHPMIVHFPIALFVVATVLVLLSWKWKPDKLLLVSRWCFWMGVAVLPIVVATGFYAIGGWGSGHVTAHRNLMLITTGLALVLSVVAFLVRKKEQRIQRMVFTVGLLILSITMTFGADRGAWLVFVEGSGVKSGGHVHENSHGH